MAKLVKIKFCTDCSFKFFKENKLMCGHKNKNLPANETSIPTHCTLVDIPTKTKLRKIYHDFFIKTKRRAPIPARLDTLDWALNFLTNETQNEL